MLEAPHFRGEASRGNTPEIQQSLMAHQVEADRCVGPQGLFSAEHPNPLQKIPTPKSRHTQVGASQHGALTPFSGLALKGKPE